MPDPVYRLLIVISLFFPQVFPPEALVNLVGCDPVGGNVFLVTSADSATFGLANFVTDPQLTLPIQIDSDHSKIFGLNEGVEVLVGFTIDRIERRGFRDWVLPGEEGDYDEEGHVEFE